MKHLWGVDSMITIDVRFISASGIGTYIQNVIPGLIRTLSNQSFTLLGDPNEIERLDFPLGTRVKMIKASSKMYSLQEQFELPKLIPKNTNLYFSPHYPIPLAYRGKLLTTVHDVFHLAMPQLVGGWHKGLYAKWMFKQLLSRADAIITVSQFTKTELCHFFPAQTEKIHPILLGVDQEWFKPSPLQNPHPRPYLLFVGNVKPNKNLLALLKAYISMLPEIESDLVIVGKKQGFMSVDAAVLNLATQYPSRIIFTDFLPKDILKAYMDHATAFVFPSLYEGFGLPPLEAMASGTPTIVSNCASMPEVCADASLYINPLSPEDISRQIGLLINNFELQCSLKIKGLERAKLFSWDKTIEQTAHLVSQLM
jgi:glycosyltransferase involved in cell wall biosynthesis